jgi:hypothetical protein
MKKFMLIVRADIEKLKSIPEEQRHADWPDMMPWLRSLADAGRHIEGAPLTLEGNCIGMGELITDGPFIESKEGILGFDIILADSFEEAVNIAKTCPMVLRGVAIREVRPVLTE